ncbi:hypothetical protein HMN09_01098800 [Mycena chlorophos]|uniref:Uncharacterized protein n=1 Tax=Mycena chlorophos TaxID=658473 RepID=A0A8H6SDH3_MYCCL|nr:hypothetical protein HMN09_01098800 [Mycena chlorophos]
MAAERSGDGLEVCLCKVRMLLPAARGLRKCVWLNLSLDADSADTAERQAAPTPTHPSATSTAVTLKHDHLALQLTRGFFHGLRARPDACMNCSTGRRRRGNGVRRPIRGPSTSQSRHVPSLAQTPASPPGRLHHLPSPLLIQWLLHRLLLRVGRVQMYIFLADRRHSRRARVCTLHALSSHRLDADDSSNRSIPHLMGIRGTHKGRVMGVARRVFERLESTSWLWPFVVQDHVRSMPSTTAASSALSRSHGGTVKGRWVDGTTIVH